MTKHSSFFLLLAGIFVLGLAAAAGPTLAAREKIQYPIAELGNCQNKAACKTYCDQPSNYAVCFAFAKKHDLVRGPLADKSEKELDRFAKIMEEGGPGNCRNQNECDAYCDDTVHLDECLAFAEKHNLMPPRELKEAKKVQAALKRGVKTPGGFTTKKGIENYCFQSHNAGGGFKEEHMEDCINFAKKAGFIKPEQEKMIRLTKGRGPGGCRGPECENFCRRPENQDTCTQFLEDLMRQHPDLKVEEIIPEEDRRRMEEDFAKMKQEMSPEMKQCLAELDPGLNKFFKGEAPLSPLIGVKMGKLTSQCMGETFPPPVRDCLKQQGLWGEIRSLRGRPSPNLEKAIGHCFAQSGPSIKEEDRRGFGPPPQGKEFRGSGLPLEVEECIKAKGEEGLLEKMRTFQGPPPSSFMEKIKDCFPRNFEMEPPFSSEGGRDFRPQRNMTAPLSFEEGTPPGFGTDPEQCLRKLKEECDQRFTGEAGKQRCLEAGRKECFQAVKGFVPFGVSRCQNLPSEEERRQCFEQFSKPGRAFQRHRFEGFEKPEFEKEEPEFERSGLQFKRPEFRKPELEKMRFKEPRINFKRPEFKEPKKFEKFMDLIPGLGGPEPEGKAIYAAPPSEGFSEEEVPPSSSVPEMMVSPQQPVESPLPTEQLTPLPPSTEEPTSPLIQSLTEPLLTEPEPAPQPILQPISPPKEEVMPSPSAEPLSAPSEQTLSPEQSRLPTIKDFLLGFLWMIFR